MRLLIVECGESKLPVVLSTQANQMKPRPEVISTVNLNMEKINIPEFKGLLRDLAPDTIVLNPPGSPADKFPELVKEVARQVEISSGRVLFRSSVEVLGDAYSRTEVAIPLPYSEMGVFLHGAENSLLGSTSRSYVMRFPYTIESEEVSAWLEWADPQKLTQPDNKDAIVNLVDLEDMAKVILTRIQMGWYGLYHATPNDQVTVYELLEVDAKYRDKLPDHTLDSRYIWDMKSSKEVWAQLYAKRYL
jgi:hypothetical protein